MPALAPMTDSQRQKYEKGLCIEPFCKSKQGNGSRCHKHIRQRFQEKNPIKHVFMYMRQNARRRGKKWELTFRQFCRFVKRENYMELKGKTPKSMTIDRKKNHLGYTKDNIQAVTLSFNSRKGDRMMYVPYYARQFEQANHAY